MFIIYSVILGVLIGYAAGGNAKWLSRRPLRWNGLAIGSFLAQILLFSDIPFLKYIPDTVTVFLHIISYLCLLIFVILNIKITGIPVIGAGILSNTLVILINGGYMPAVAQNLKNTSIGKSFEAISQGNAVHNSIGMTRNTLLPWLGDIFYLPSWVPMSNVFSIGDILIAVGICLYLVINMRAYYE